MDRHSMLYSSHNTFPLRSNIHTFFHHFFDRDAHIGETDLVLVTKIISSNVCQVNEQFAGDEKNYYCTIRRRYNHDDQNIIAK